MKILIFAVLHDGCGEVATHSKDYEIGIGVNPEDEAEAIIQDIASTSIGRVNIYEVFCFKSAANFGDAPEQVAYWNQEDGLFGPEVEDE